MPILQQGLPTTYGQARSNEYDTRYSPQQYRQPLVPPQRSSTDNLASPIALIRQSPEHRRMSGQHGFIEREQSAEVSPKTMSLPRPQSLGSRQSSLHEATPAYQSGSQPENSHFSTHMPQNSHSMGQPPQLTSGQHSRVSSVTSNSHTHPSSASPTFAQQAVPRSQSRDPANSYSERPPVKRSHTMTMEHLLAPTTHDATPASRPPVKKEPVEDIVSNGDTQTQSEWSRKRVHEDDLDVARPHKKGKTTRRTVRPIWAMLSKRNPAWSVERGFKDEVKPEPNGTSRPKQEAIAHDDAAHALSTEPWTQPLPYDMELIRAREVLGEWEKSIRWNTTYPDTLAAVQDWLYRHLLEHQDIVQDASLGSIEIEAKIGHLVKPSTGEHATLPVLSATLLDPAVNRDYRFESELQEVSLTEITFEENATDILRMIS